MSILLFPPFCFICNHTCTVFLPVWFDLFSLGCSTSLLFFVFPSLLFHFTFYPSCGHHICPPYTLSLHITLIHSPSLTHFHSLITDPGLGLDLHMPIITLSFPSLSLYVISSYATTIFFSLCCTCTAFFPHIFLHTLSHISLTTQHQFSTIF